MLRRFTGLGSPRLVRVVSACAPAPAPAADIRFHSTSSTPNLHFIGAYQDASGGVGSWSAFKDDARTLKPVSGWPWHFAQQFTELVPDVTLALPKAPTEMLPAMQVFSRLDMDDDILLKWEPTSGGNVYDHCNIEGVIDQVGYGLIKPARLEEPSALSLPDAAPSLQSTSDDVKELRRLLREAARERKQLLKAIKQRDEVIVQVQQHEAEVGQQRSRIIDANRVLVGQLSVARKLDASDAYPESSIDLLAQSFLTLCGFNDGETFSVSAAGSDFRIFGMDCHSKADFYVVLSQKGDLVLVIEDKAEKLVRAPHAAILNHGHLGQIVGEALQVLSVNREKNAFRTVFALRFINHHFSAFRVDVSKRTLATLVDTQKVPEEKMQFRCTTKDPLVNRGWSLIDKSERTKALQTMANIRSFLAQ